MANEDYQAGYRDGLRAGIERFAWWKDGTEYVGTCGTTLRQALVDAEIECFPAAESACDSGVQERLSRLHAAMDELTGVLEGAMDPQLSVAGAQYSTQMPEAYRKYALRNGAAQAQGRMIRLAVERLEELLVRMRILLKRERAAAWI